MQPLHQRGPRGRQQRGRVSAALLRLPTFPHLLPNVVEHVVGEVLDELVVELLICVPGPPRYFLRRGCCAKSGRRRFRRGVWASSFVTMDRQAGGEEAGRGREGGKVLQSIRRKGKNVRNGREGDMKV